jgi:hypothetical protein
MQQRALALIKQKHLNNHNKEKKRDCAGDISISYGTRAAHRVPKQNGKIDLTLFHRFIKNPCMVL